MKNYVVKIPWWVKKIYPSYVWNINTDKKILYLTFDDGPHPEITLFVLDQLKKYNAKATFFCIGKNVMAFPELFQQVCAAGHAVGNHTFSHLNGWKTKDEEYFNDIAQASNIIHSSLFRPPYGKITSFQARGLHTVMEVANPKVIMWDVLSADFDSNITPQKTIKHVINNSRPGSIIVFHDSEKAFPRLKTLLPATLDFFSAKGFQFEELSKIDLT